MRLIDADALKENLMKYIGLTNGLERAFKETPTIEPEQKKGWWIKADEIDEWYGRMYKCSVCGCENWRADKYCANCGAKMEK